MFEFLDEFATVIYQGFHRFCLFTKVNDDDELVFHVGLVDEARWWKGVWTEEQVTAAVKTKLSDYLLEIWSHNVQQKFVDGELVLDIKGTLESSMRLTIDPSKQAFHIQLDELSTEEAAKYTISALYDLAIQAQTRQCRLNPESPPMAREPTKTSPKKPQKSDKPQEEGEPEATMSMRSSTTGNHSITPTKRKSHAKPTAPNQAERDKELEELKAQLQKEKAKNVKITEESVKQAVPTNVSGPAVTKRKGASLHNPTKKARRYKPIDYGSD